MRRKAEKQQDHQRHRSGGRARAAARQGVRLAAKLVAVVGKRDAIGGEDACGRADGLSCRADDGAADDDALWLALSGGGQDVPAVGGDISRSALKSRGPTGGPVQPTAKPFPPAMKWPITLTGMATARVEAPPSMRPIRTSRAFASSHATAHSIIGAVPNVILEKPFDARKLQKLLADVGKRDR